MKVATKSGRVLPDAGAPALPEVRAYGPAVVRADPLPDTGVGGARAAGELGLTRTEFARAVQLGIVRAGPPAPGAEPRATRGRSWTGSGRRTGSRARCASGSRP